MAAGQQRFEIKVSFLLDGLPSQVYEINLLKGLVLRCQDLPLPLLLSVETVLLGLEAKPHEKARSWIWLLEAI